MILYDDKTKNAIRTGNQLLYPSITHAEDITFQASYVISGDVNCDGRITALFDLIVFGDINAEEVDIKGRFICTGKCSVSGAVIVQNDIWAEDIQAESITCRDRIVAQSIDANTVVADGNIIIGKTLAVEDKAQTYQHVMCGETAFGAGKIVATSILTVEPLDLDDGEEAIESPFQYTPKAGMSGTSELSKESRKYAQNNDYSGFINKLMKIPDAPIQTRLARYLRVLKAVDLAYPASITEFKDVSILVWLVEIANSEYFREWAKIQEWLDALLTHFRDMSEGKASEINEPKPATKLMKGYTVVHSKYGQGVVMDIQSTTNKGKTSYMGIIKFDLFGEKKFPLPDSLKFFSVLSEKELPTAESIRESIQCSIDSYAEWLAVLQTINDYSDYLGSGLYNTIYTLVLSKLGLKPKFVEDRFKEKGWN